MIVNLEATAAQYLNDGEEIYWVGQPVPEKSVKTVRPVMILLSILGWMFILFALYKVLASTLPEYRSNYVSDPFFDIFLHYLYVHKLSLIAGLSFLLFRYMLPNRLLPDEGNVIYMITDERVLTIHHTGNPEVIFYGPGDIQRPTVRKRGVSSGDLLFVEESLPVGDFDDGNQRWQLEWIGFENVDDVANAKKALNEWLKNHNTEQTVYNKSLDITLTLPMNWTIESLDVAAPLRDETLFLVLADEIIKDGRSIKNKSLQSGDWNTLIMSKRGPSQAGNSNAEIIHMTIMIEVAKSRHGSADQQKRVRRKLSPYLQGVYDKPEEFMQTLKDNFLICKFNDLFDHDKKKKTFQPKINFEARNINLNDMQSFILDRTISLVKPVAFRQIYSYHDDLHIRATFVCPNINKGKFFTGNSSNLDKIMKTLRLHESAEG